MRAGWGRLVSADVRLAPTRNDSHTRRAVFSAEDPVTEWAPNGVEAKITGPSGSRKVWLGLVVESQATKGRTAVHANTVIVSVRDL